MSPSRSACPSRSVCPSRSGIFAAVLSSALVLAGCASPDETETVEQLRQLGALVVLDVNKKASSIVLPSEPEKIEQALPLLPQLRHLTSVGAINAPITDDALKTVGRLKGLTNVDVSGTAISDAGVKHLVGLPKLASLNLASTKVTSACLADLGNMAGIQMLNLANTQLSGGFEHLSGCRELSWLVLSHLTLSDADAESLAAHPYLKRLSASDHVTLSDQAASVLQAKGIQVDLAKDTGQQSAASEP